MRHISAIIITLSMALSQEDRAQADFLYTTLVPPNSYASSAYGINDRGDIVGNYDTPGPGGESNGFVLSNGVYTPIVYGVLTGTNVTGINNAGSMVGYYYLPFDSYPGGFTVIGGTITGLNI